MINRRILVPPTARSDVPGRALPAEIEVRQDGTAVAHYPNGTDSPTAASLEVLCNTLGIDRALLADWTSVMGAQTSEE